MSRYLFVMWDGGGNTPPELSVARALTDRGHDVRVLCDPTLLKDVALAGGEPVAWTRAPHRATADPQDVIVRDWETRSPLQAFAQLRDAFMCGPAADIAADVLEEIERRPADALVADFALFGAHAAAEAAELPWAVLVPNAFPFPAAGRPPFGAGWAPARTPLGRGRDALVHSTSQRLWRKGLPALNAARDGLGLPALATPTDAPLRADRVLVLTDEGFDLGRRGLPDHVRFCGPRLEDPAWAHGWEPPPGDAPLVLVSLSSTFQDQRAVLERIAVALGQLPVRGLVTTGPSIDPATIAAPANVAVVAQAPHAAVLQHAAAVVTHGGHGTTIKALAAGVPIVCLPMGRDQPDTAARLVHSGAGIRLRPSARPATIARAVRRVLGDPAYARAAGVIADSIAASRSRDAAADELEALAEPAPVAAMAR